MASRRNCDVCSLPFCFEDGVAVAAIYTADGDTVVVHPRCRDRSRQRNYELMALCPVCEDALPDSKLAIVGYIRRCNHVFHTPCIESYVEQYKQCPVCQCEVASRRGINAGFRRGFLICDVAERY